MTNEGHETRRINTAALRTLHALECTLRRQIAELHEIDCEDVEAAEAVVFAIEEAEKALANALAARRGQFRD